MTQTSRHVRVEGQLNLYRNIDSGALISTMGNKRVQKEEKRRKDSELENKVNYLCQELDTIKGMFKEFMINSWERK